VFFEFFFFFTNIVYSTDLRQRIAKSSKHKGDFSTADTLRDTTDLVVQTTEQILKKIKIHVNRHFQNSLKTPVILIILKYICLRTCDQLCLTLMQLALFVQIYRGGQFYWWRKLEYLEKTTDLPQ
jgi:hypothetical protein